MVVKDRMHVEEPKPSWHILGTDAEALERALAFEDTMARHGEARADHYAQELAHVKRSAVRRVSAQRGPRESKADRVAGYSASQDDQPDPLGPRAQSPAIGCPGDDL